MKMFIKNSYLFLIFFILFFSKNFLYGLIAPKDKIDLSNIYINRLEKEIDDLKLLNDDFYETSGVYGKVLYQNPYKFNQELVVATQTDKINKNNYVITSSGLLGVVDKVYQNHIIVKMILNKDILMQIKVGDCYGLLKYDEYLYVSNISNYCSVNIEDEVYTSNLGYMEETVLIGKIKSVINRQNQVNNDYEITPIVDFNNLNYVVILTGGNL